MRLWRSTPLVKAVVVSALGEEGVSEAIGVEAESAAARLRAADDGVTRVLLIAARAQLDEQRVDTCPEPLTIYRQIKL